MIFSSENIQKLRAQLGWTQQQLADELGISRRSIIRWEKGNKSPGRKMREKLNQLENVTSENVTSENVTSENVTSENVTSENVTSENVTSENVTSENVTSENVTSENVTSENVTSENVTSENVTSENVTSENVSSHDTNDTTQNDTNDTKSENVSSENVSSNENDTKNVSSSGNKKQSGNNPGNNLGNKAVSQNSESVSNNVSSNSKNDKNEKAVHPPSKYDPAYIVSVLELLGHREAGGVTEVRIFPNDRYLIIKGRREYVGATVSGYYNDYQKLASDIAPFDGKANIYVTINPCKPELLARAANRLRFAAKTTTSDDDILCDLWFPVDIDPIRPADISSTSDELLLSIARRDEIVTFLSPWAQTIKGMSGSGGHSLIRLRGAMRSEPFRAGYPNDAETRQKKERLTNTCMTASQTGSWTRKTIPFWTTKARR